MEFGTRADQFTSYVIAYRHADARLPFLWEGTDQPASRWNEQGQGPVQYLADTPDGAWAEFIRHEGITKPEELANVRRRIWAVELPDSVRLVRPRLPREIATGGRETYELCRRESQRLRRNGARGLRAPSSALLPGQAGGWRVHFGLRRGTRRNGYVLALFGPQPHLRGWVTAHAGRPEDELLSRVRPLRPPL